MTKNSINGEFTKQTAIKKTQRPITNKKVKGAASKISPVNEEKNNATGNIPPSTTKWYKQLAVWLSIISALIPIFIGIAWGFNLHADIKELKFKACVLECKNLVLEMCNSYSRLGCATPGNKLHIELRKCEMKNFCALKGMK